MDESFSRDKLGGLTSLRGLYYQYVYSLELARELLQPAPADACELIEDFLAWGSHHPEGTLSRVLRRTCNAQGSRCVEEAGRIGDRGPGLTPLAFVGRETVRTN